MDFFGEDGEVGEAGGGDDVGVFGADGTDVGDDELGFDGERHVLFELSAVARGDSRGFVELDTDTVADETCLLAVAHEVLGEVLLGGDGGGTLVEFADLDPGEGDLLQFAQYADGAVVGFAGQFGDIADAPDAGHVGLVAVEGA